MVYLRLESVVYQAPGSRWYATLPAPWYTWFSIDNLVYLWSSTFGKEGTMRKLRCPNPDPNATHPRGGGVEGFREGAGLTGWSGIPDMVRLYIRESSKTTHDKAGNEIPYYDQKTKRTWTPVGQMCPGCGWIQRDDQEAK